MGTAAGCPQCSTASVAEPYRCTSASQALTDDAATAAGGVPEWAVPVAVAVGVLAIFIGGLAFYLGCKSKRRSPAVVIPPELARGLEMSRFTPVGRTEINDGIDESTAI